MRRTHRQPMGDILETSRSRTVSFATHDCAKNLQAAPELSLVFKTNALGNLLEIPKDDVTKNILFPIAYLSHDLRDRAFESLKFSAMEMGRKVSSFKDGQSYFVEFGPVGLR